MKRLSILVLIILCLNLTACRHTIEIRTKPEGAAVWVNFVPLKRSPSRYYARTGLPGTARVKVALDGYEPVRDFPIEKSYHADISLLWLLAGVIPYFFTARYEESVTIPLKKIPDAEESTPAPSPSSKPIK